MLLPRLELARVRVHPLVRRLQRLGRLERLARVLARGQKLRRPLAYPNLHVDLLLEIVLLSK